MMKDEEKFTDLAELAAERTKALQRWHGELEKLARHMINGGRQTNSAQIEAVTAARYTFDIINVVYAGAQKRSAQAAKRPPAKSPQKIQKAVAAS